MAVVTQFEIWKLQGLQVQSTLNEITTQEY